MRCAASAIGYFWDEEILTYNAIAGAVITHADPKCVASCVAITALMAQVFMGKDLSTTEKRREEVVSAGFSAARHLQGGDSDELFQFMDVELHGLTALQLGTGGIGYTYKPLGAACWAFVHAQNFKDAIQAITMEAGDADSNAAVAGAVLGARLGFSSLPKSWLDEVPLEQKKWLDGKIKLALKLLGLTMSSM